MKKAFLLVLLCSSSVFAQLSDQQYLSIYKEAVNLFNSGNYDESYTKITPLVTKNYQNAVAPYAYLYGALAAEKKGNKYQSKVLYRNLLNYYPDWDKINDARVLYAQASFKDGYFEEALKTLQEIDDSSYKNIVTGLIAEEIPNVKTLAALKNLNTKFPNYKPIAKALVDKIQSNRYNSKADLELSDMLTNRFNLLEPEKKTTTSKKPVTPSKNTGYLNFGLLLPFDLASATPPSSSHYIYELYQGMQIAAENLAQEGISLGIHAYDVKNNANDFKTASAKTGFSKLDMIVGPLYPKSNTPAQAFVNENDIIQVHPISNNLSLLSNSKNAFLLQPSHSQQAKKSLEYIIHLGLPKTVSVFYGEAKKDSLFASIYAAEAKKRGFTVTEFKKFTSQKIKPQKGHIFLAGDNNVGPQFIQSLAMDNIDCEAIITASAFSWDKVTTSNFTEKVALIYPEFVNTNKEVVKDFDKKYFAKTAGIPSYYSYLGYDLAYYFANMLKDGKRLFKTNTEMGEYSDNYMLSGYDFSDKVKQNDIVPIVKYMDGHFEEIYR